MKAFKKIVITTTILATSIVSLSAFADETTATNSSETNSITSTWVTTPTPRKWIMLEVKAARQWVKEAKEVKKEERKTLIENNQKLREEAKENREKFKSENDELKVILWKLTQEIQTQIKALWVEHRAAIDILQTELSNSWTTDARKEEIKTQMKTLNEAHIAKVIELAWSTDEVKAYFAKKAELITTNEELRKQAKENRTEFRQWMSEIVTKYKTLYLVQLKLVIPRLWDTKLEEVSAKIDAMIAKIDANTTMSEDNKTKLLAQITSIKEIIQEELDSRATADETFDINTILE